MGPGGERIAQTFWLFAAMAIATPALAHPASGIVVDDCGRVWFMDTGFGMWQIDASGRLTAQGGPGGHFLAIDRQGRFKWDHFSRLPHGDVEVARIDPTLLVATSYPVTVGSDGALYYPQVAGKGRVRIMRMAPGEPPQPFASLPVAREIGYDGKEVEAEWVWGLAAGPDGSLYYTEQQAVRRIAPDGTVSLVAGNIIVPECERPPACKDAHAETSLYGLDVAADGTVYVAASACSAVLKIGPDGNVSVALRATSRWSPQGVALVGDTLYVLEYDYVVATEREAWMPRVRKLAPDGTVTLLAQVEKRPDRGNKGLLQLPGAVLRGMKLPPRKHGAMVHFPIVLFFVSVPATVLALAVRRRFAPRVQMLVIFVAIVAFCVVSERSGERAATYIPFGPDGVPGIVWEQLRQHTRCAEKLKVIAFGGAIASLASLAPTRLRYAAGLRTGAMLLALCAALGGSATAVVTAHYGGELVYGQGVGSESLLLYLDEKAATNDAVLEQRSPRPQSSEAPNSLLDDTE